MKKTLNDLEKIRIIKKMLIDMHSSNIGIVIQEAFRQARKNMKVESIKELELLNRLLNKSNDPRH
jgi:hypothetical protein